MFKIFSRNGIRWIRKQDALYLGLLSIIIGLLAGYGALMIRYSIEWISAFWTGSTSWSAVLHSTPWYFFIIAPTCGGLLVGCINRWWLDTKQTRLISGVLEALSEQGGKINIRKATGETLANIIAVGSGASMGREAPTVGLGAAISSVAGQWLHLSEQQMRTLIGCGVAAGIAASFNAPIAGVLFALEVILADYAIATFSPIVLSAVIATVVTRAELGNISMLVIPQYRLVSGWEIPAYCLLGVFCGLLATLMIHRMHALRLAFARFVHQPFLRPAAAGLLLGVCALVIPEVMSIGSHVLNDLLLENSQSLLFDSSMPLIIFLLLLLVMKIITSMLCAAGGFGGGMIGPSVFIGATVGAIFGLIYHQLFPDVSASYGAYTLVACGAMMAAMLQAPMSSILMIFELSGNYHIMLPLMAACIIAAMTKRIFGRTSVLTEPLEVRGIEVNWQLERSWMRSIKVGSIERKPLPCVSHRLALAQLKHEYINVSKGCLGVLDDDGFMLGIVTFDDLQPWLLDSSLDYVVVAAEIANKNVRTIPSDSHLLEAIRIFDTEKFEQLPIVSAKNPRKVLGMLARHAVFSTYHRMIVEHGEREKM
ncbi:MAG: chloride channel protein [Mariprofundaceae bacterium]|nr:chloride channel protein [Mariprofundaceae bacterium]